MDRINTALAIIGGGTMARAIFDGAVSQGVLDGRQVIVAEPQPERRVYFAGRGCAVYESSREALKSLSERERPGEPVGIVLLAVKPQVLPSLAPETRGCFPPDGPARVVVSILAGTPAARVSEALGSWARVVRAMPNMPAQIGRGTTAMCLGPGATWEDAGTAERLFQAVGSLVVRIDEDMMDAFTALCGSGPGYVFLLAQAMVDAGVHLGFERAMAEKLVRETVAGSGELLARTSQSAGELLAAVQSKRGTTEAAVNVLTRAGVHDALISAITAARDRGRELNSTQ